MPARLDNFKKTYGVTIRGSGKLTKLGQDIELYRDARNMSLEAVARKLGITRHTLYRAMTNPRAVVQLRTARVLNWLLTGEKHDRSD